GKLEAALAPGLTTEIYDMFNVPWGEWWDYRTAVYGDTPLGADCFSFDSIPGGAGSPNPAGTGVCDVPPTGYSGETWDTYPYSDVYPWYGNRQSIAIYAPYRMRMTGIDQPGSTLAQPVILPVFNSAADAGTTLSVNWDMQYLNTARVNELNGVCASIYQDGFLIESFITATMDLQESKRLFGVVATTDAEAQSWWDANVNPDCFLKGTIETKWQDFMIGQGGVAGAMGTYDVFNSFEWYYQPFMSAFSAVVDPATHLTTVKIDHVAWGTEVLLARWFHWGPNSYLQYAETYPQNYAGWWKWYLAWFEDLHFSTNIGSAAQSFTLSTAMNYQLQAYANPGPDRVYHTGTVSSTDDFAEWLWQPFLTDYAYGGTASVKHTVSELDPYATYTYNHGTPCSVFYGTNFQYEFVPAEWDLGSADTVTVRAPLSPVDFVDVYSPLTSDASTCATFSASMGFYKSTPALPAGSSATDSNGDSILDTVTLVGLIDWGAPAQPLWGYPALEFTAQVPPPPELRKADLIGRSAWPERHHFVLSKDADGVQSLYAKVGNLGNIEVSAAVIFEIRDSTGALVATIHTATVKIGIALSVVIVDGWTSPVPGKYSVTAVVHYDADGGGTLDTFGLKVKSFSFAVVP
ncbi:MAG: hypothetical protein WC985_04050, partial [Thermoplasmata archaeon]